jgi:hypothetical protein
MTSFDDEIESKCKQRKNQKKKKKKGPGGRPKKARFFLLLSFHPSSRRMEKVMEGVIEGVLAPHGAFAVFVIKAAFEAGSKVVKV